MYLGGSMCVRVEYSSLLPADLWDPSARLITLPVTLSSERAVPVVRAVLRELAVEQPAIGAVCFCGEPIRLTSHVAQQRTRSTEVMTRGA